MNVFLPHLDPDATNGVAADANTPPAPVAAPVAPAPVTDNSEIAIQSLLARQEQMERQVQDLAAQRAAASVKPVAQIDSSDPVAMVAAMSERLERMENRSQSERDAFVKEQFVARETERAAAMTDHFTKNHPVASTNQKVAEICKNYVANTVRSILSQNPQTMITPLQLQQTYNYKAQELADVIAAHTQAAIPPVDQRVAQHQASQAAGPPVVGGAAPALPGQRPPKLGSDEDIKMRQTKTRAIFSGN